jgi:hypothetical protein
VLRPDASALQLDGNVAVHHHVIEEQVYIELLAPGLEVVLLAEKRKSSTQFKKQAGVDLDGQDTVRPADG